MTLLAWILAGGSLAMTGLVAAMFVRNLSLFVIDHESESKPDFPEPSISVLIPARDEEGGIGAAVESALASRGVDVEVVVLDDHSTDRTGAIVSAVAAADERVRLKTSRPLPDGWNGKQYACRQLADLARNEVFAFIDADVRLSPHALLVLERRRRQLDLGLISAFPNQVTGTIAEKAIIPMMHYVLLGFLPMSRMRRSAHPAYASGCGQLFLTDRRSYHAAGTHEAIASSRHDGLKLPRAYRERGLKTDVVDGTDLARCRMYTSTAEVVRGVVKNATEAIANPRVIVPFTTVLLGCSLLPVVAIGASIVAGAPGAAAISVVALVLAHVPRMLAAARLRQSWLGAALHVPATIAFVGLQWAALSMSLAGRQVAWRGRT